MKRETLRRFDRINSVGELPRRRTVDLDTGLQIPFCLMADADTGQYVALAVSATNPREVVMDPQSGHTIRVYGHARLEIQVLRPREPYWLEDVNDPGKWYRPENDTQQEKQS